MQNFSQEELSNMSIDTLHALRQDCVTLLAHMQVVDKHVPELLAKIDKALADK